MKYMYKCTDQPIASVCQKAKCKLRKFGVGTSGQDHPVYANLRVTDREPRIWYLDIDSHPVETQVQDEIEYHHRLRKLVKRKLSSLVKSIEDDCHPPRLDTLTPSESFFLVS